MRVIDSHTEGEPTRLIIEGGPELGRGPMSEQRDRLARDFDVYRRTAILEPRGSDILVVPSFVNRPTLPVSRE